MAIKARKSVAAVSEKPSPKSSFPKVGTIILLESRATLEEQKDDKDLARLYAQVEVGGITEQANGYFFTCNISAGRRSTETELPVFVSARYGCIIETDERDSELLSAWSADVARTMIWGRFSDLFALVNNQMRQRLPVLPIFPDNVSMQ